MQKRLREEILKMRFNDVYSRFKGKKLSSEQASDILGMSLSTFYRIRQRYEYKEDMSDLIDRRRGKVSPHRASDEEVKFITNLYKSRYHSFNIKHFYALSKEKHLKKRSYNWVRNTLIKRGLAQKRVQGKKHRQKRDRKPLEGMMLHQDGSSHRWIKALSYDIDLIVTLDDATSKITSAFFVHEEGTMSSLQGLQETIENEGLFCSLYTDRGSHYFHTPKAGGRVDKGAFTQVGRALQQLKIQHIAGYSPEGRGRSERAFRTLQGRLPNEFECFGIQSMERANQYLKETFIPRYNKEFSQAPKEPQKAFVPWMGSFLRDILCIQEKRMVRKDNTVSFEGKVLQIPQNPERLYYGKAEIEVHKYLNGSLSLFYGPLCLGQYNKEGQLVKNRPSLKTGCQK